MTHLLRRSKPHPFADLLAFLSNTKPFAPGNYQNWHYARVAGGANNLVYRTIQGEAFAVKFYIRDERDRAGREHAALSLLREHGERLAPEPVFLERERYFRPVVAQTWLDGEVLEPPQTASAWASLLNYYAALHQVRPTQKERTVVHAIHTATSVAEGKALVRQHSSRLPKLYPPGLHRLLERFERLNGPLWPYPRLSLCRVDPNVTNFVRTANGLRSVDWENSGWGDPAFEMADLLAHPAYGPASAETAARVAERYADLTANRAAAVRIGAYFRVVLVYWVVRFARTLYEVPRGLDERLVARPETWHDDGTRKYGRYLELASAQL